MLKMTKRKALLFVIALIICLCLTGCSGNKYNAVLYETAIGFMQEDYIAANMTRNSLIPESKDAPITITHLISTKDQFDIAFKEFPVEVDFDKEILIVYFFTGYSSYFSYEGERIVSHTIKKLNVEKEEISITIKEKLLVHSPTGMPPTHSCMVVKMDKVEATTANVEMVYR